MLRIRISIRTPKGYALSTAKRLRPYIIGARRIKNEVWANRADNHIIWVVDAEAKDYLAIVRNVSLYDTLVKGALSNKLLQRAAKLSDADKKELDKMLHEDTRITIVKHYDDIPRYQSDADWEKQSD